VPTTLKARDDFIDPKIPILYPPSSFLHLLADLRAVILGKIEIAERAVKIHARAQHVGIGDKNLLAFWTGHLYSLTHDLPLNIF
jgi:hypothetical protein